MFTPSTQAISAAVLEIADSGGASADTEMQGRALRSLNAGIKYLNGRQNWSWLLTENAPISVVAPFGFTATVSAGQASGTIGASHGLLVDDFLVGANFQVGTRVTATGATTLGFSRTVTATAAGANAVSATANRDFYDFPTDWKMPYTVRLLTSKRTLGIAPRRSYDRSTTDEFTTSTPAWYDLFAGYQKGKMQLLPPPSQADTLLLRYYRRMSVASASADATALDIPQDYDFHLIAWAKWHFLTDKGLSDRAQTWLTLSQEGIKTMLSDQTRIPDEDLAFQPGRFHNVYSTSSTRYPNVSWDYT